VWLQSPDNAERYRRAGINTRRPVERTYRGATREAEAAGMKLICHQNQVGLKHAQDATILAWMHGDEPDNAQSSAPAKVMAHRFRRRRSLGITKPSELLILRVRFC
jgi:hypothetical protein